MNSLVHYFSMFQDTTNLQVMITDINDNPPRFSDSHYYTYINENTVSGPVLLVSGFIFT